MCGYAFTVVTGKVLFLGNGPVKQASVSVVQLTYIPTCTLHL